MNLNPNIPETKIPGSYTEFNYYAGPNGLPANIQKVLLIGDKSSAGSIAAYRPTEVATEQEAIALAGSGSVLMQMYKAAKKAWRYAQISFLCYNVADGSAATWAFTLTGSATAAGQVGVECNGVKIVIGVAKTDAAADIATAIAAEINNTPDAPFTAAAASGTVTLTAKCKGAYVSTAAGGLNVSAFSTATGVTAGSVTVTAGTGSVNLETALAFVFAERYHIVVSPVNDATNLGYLKTHLEAAAAPLEQRGQRAICAMIATPTMDGTALVRGAATNAANAAKAQNYERVHIAAVKNKLNATAWEIAAGVGAIFASNSKPNVPMNGDAIPGIAIPDIEDKWSGEEQDVLLYGGVIPLVEENGQLCIVRAVTTRTKNSGAEWNKLNDTGVIASLDYFRDCILAMHRTKYKKKVVHAFLADALNEDNKAVASDLEDEQILRYIDEYADQFIAQESPNVPGRILCQIPAPVVPGLNQIYNTIDLYL
ncbi:MAG: phage tail sheath subtilisin-like domain-containing protein [Fibrobacter sp.]|nr:phage tail sheath subtilisin-like domain-containing protein [Fibrobacter sp.]MBR4680919.1 phage tail sheath subtilisin-like domain-containing protein [Fibrobacter sp.]MBR6941953.1 phage tail sheath subtilisin-like domain-containing protein [Fibrobacter sp.]